MVIGSRSDDTTSVVMPVSDMQGRTVWTDDGTRLGTIRRIHSDEAGRIVAFDVRERWILGDQFHVSADGMRLDEGDVVVPASATIERIDGGRRHGRAEEPTAVAPTASTMPVLLAGRDGARGRFGGVDLLGSAFGALAAIATLAMLGSLLAAIFDTGMVQLDTSITSFSDVGSDTLVLTGIVIAVAGLVGGWAAGRAARFDGAANGVLAVAWMVAFSVAFALLGLAAGDDYDVLAGSVVPRIDMEAIAWAGVLGFAAGVLLMLVTATVGGMLGEAWHRRADRAMLDVVPVAPASGTTAAASTDAQPLGGSTHPGSSPLVD